MLHRIVSVGLVGLVVVACGSSSSRSGFDQPGDGSSGGTVAGDPGSIGGQPAGANPQADECQKMDIIFVVDDSGSMGEEQSNLATNFPQFVNAIDAYTTKSGSKLDWRIAVTTTGRDLNYTVDALGVTLPQNEKGDNGAFRNKCGPTKRWVEKADTDASSTFSCRAEVGTSGPSIEMPLYSLKLALNDRMADGTNAGFLRPDALLAVVILTDEDDCSREDNNFTIQSDSCKTMQNLHPVSEYAAMLDAAAGGTGRWATAVIAGDKECTSSFGKAIEASRLKDFVSLAGSNGIFSSICAGDLTVGLKGALDTFDAACKNFPGVR
jgi:hypothetical protein